MDPSLMALSVGAPAVAAIFGYLVQTQSEDKAKDIMDRARAEYGGLTPPALEKATADVLGPTMLSKIRTDPAFKSAQMDVMAKMKQISDNGGMTLEDQANLNRIHDQNQRDASGRDQQIQENMQARGIGGSGDELAMRLSSGQAAAGRERQAGLDVAGQAQARALAALKSRGDMATSLRSQDYGEQANAAAAQDAINKFNLLNKQNVINQNNRTAEDQWAYNKASKDWDYQGQVADANYERQKGERFARLAGSLGKAAGQGAGSAGSMGGDSSGGGSQYGGDYASSDYLPQGRRKPGDTDPNDVYQPGDEGY